MSNLTNKMARYTTAAGRADIAALRFAARCLTNRDTQIKVILEMPAKLCFNNLTMTVDYEPKGSGRGNCFFLIRVTDRCKRHVGTIVFRPSRYAPIDKPADIKIIW